MVCRALVFPLVKGSRKGQYFSTEFDSLAFDRQVLYWCRGEDLNLHTLRYLLLRQACLPISPPRLRRLVYTIFNRGAFTFTVICSTLVPYPPIAQLVEQSPLKRTVLGSSPSGRTNKIHPLVGCILFVRPRKVSAHLSSRARRC